MNEIAIQEERRWGNGFLNLKDKNLPSLKAKRAIDAIASLPQGAEVLDYGCGEGKLLNTIEIYRPDFKMSGLDVQKPLDLNPAFKFALVENDKCEFFQNKYDAILSLDVLEHVPDLEKTLGRITEMLKPGGVLVLFVPMEGENFSPYGFYRLIFGKDLYAKTKSHIHAYKKKEFLKLLSNYFSIKKVSYSYHVLGTFFDSTFFALTILKSLSLWWWKKNSVYHPENKKKGVLNKMMEAANILCYFEDEWFEDVSLFSSGLHVVALKKSGSPISS